MTVAYGVKAQDGSEEELRVEYKQTGTGKRKAKYLDVRIWCSNTATNGEFCLTPKGFTVPDDEEQPMALICALAEAVGSHLRITKAEMLSRIDMHLRDWQGKCTPPPT